MTADLAHILVVLDAGAKQQPALERGAWLAERTGAALELFVCDYDQDLAASPHFDPGALECARRHLLAAHRRTLEAHAKRLAARGIHARVDVRWAHPLDASIVEKAAEARTDLVLKSTRYHAEIGRSLFSAVDWSLMTSCPTNLWLAKPRSVSEPPTILAAVDPRSGIGDAGAALDARILDIGVRLERALRGELHVFHGFDISSALAASADALRSPISAPVRDLRSDLLHEHRRGVLALTDRVELARERVHVHEGPVRQLLTAWAREMNSDVLAVGAVSRGALPRRHIGSLAQQVLDAVPCDLLIVAPGTGV